MSEAPIAYQIGGIHYLTMGVQPWEAMENWLPRDQWIGYLRGSAIKYLARAGTKGDFREDILKANHYLEKLIEALDDNVGA